jgi:hypothetical protein
LDKRRTTSLFIIMTIPDKPAYKHVAERDRHLPRHPQSSKANQGKPTDFEHAFDEVNEIEVPIGRPFPDHLLGTVEIGNAGNSKEKVHE